MSSSGSRTWSAAQQSAICARGGDVLVSAGAGSGKTSVLVERVVQSVIGDLAFDLDRLLVVTFTEAAASEMRERIVTSLQTRLKRTRESGDGAIAERLARQTVKIEQAHISTLHSLCFDIVRRNFLYLGIDPRFSLMSSEDSTLFHHAVFDKWLDESLEADDAGRFRRMLQRFGVVQPKSLFSLTMRLYTFSRSQAEPTDWLRTACGFYEQAAWQGFEELVWADAFRLWIGSSLADVATQLEEALALAFGHAELAAYADNLREFLSAIQLAMEVFRQERGLAGGTQALADAVAIGGRRVTAKEHPAKAEVQRLRNGGKAGLATLYEVLHRGEPELIDDLVTLAPDVRVLTDFVLEFQRRADIAKRARGVLDFSDLEQMAHQVLIDAESGEAARLQEKFVEVYVDEYQDTSPIQDELIRQIARAEGNLFLVGDVKQSIYRFRMAEPRLFLEKYHSLQNEGSGTVINLAENYRSRAEIVEAVNFLFGQLFTSDFGGIAYDERNQMKAGAQYPVAEVDDGATLSGPVEFCLIEREELAAGRAHPEGDDGAGESSAVTDAQQTSNGDRASGDQTMEPEELTALEKEALFIGRRIQELVGGSGGTQPTLVFDANARHYRPIQYRDVVVLLRSARGRVGSFLDVFRGMDIPAYGATSQGFFDSLEIRWLVAALSAVDNPRRELDLVTLMKSPLGGFTDTDLAAIRAGHRGHYFDAVKRAAKTGGWDGPQDSVGLSERARLFVRQLRLWRRIARRSSVEEVLKKLLADTGFLHYVTGMRGGELRRANVELFLERARLYDQSAPDGVYGFLEVIRDANAHEIDTGEARAAGENENVVRVMTIHQSKGLEFPVVFVADLGRNFYRPASEAAFALHRDLGYGSVLADTTHHRKWRTVSTFAVNQAEQIESLTEEARILYVALTRAREKLILVGSARRTDRMLLRAAIAGAWPQRELPWTRLLTAKSWLDWLIPALIRHPDATALRLGDGTVSGDDPLVPASVHVLDGSASFKVNVLMPSDLHRHEESSAPSTCSPGTTDADEPNGSDTQSLGLNRGRRELDLEWEHPYAWLAGVPGKISATELRRLWTQKFQVSRASVAEPRNFVGAGLLDEPSFSPSRQGSGRELGTAFHAVMQQLDFLVEPTHDEVLAELRRIGVVDEAGVNEQMQGAIDEVMSFLNSPVAGRIRNARQVFREHPFLGRIQLTSPGTNPSGEADDWFVVAQGVIDLLFEEDDRWIVVDYKTDNISADVVTEKADEYAAQIAMYVQVVRSLVNKPVEGIIYFVKPGCTVPMRSFEDMSAVFRP